MNIVAYATEAMLVTQSHILDMLFHRLTRQAVMNIGHYPESVERYMKLALRAQSQCRANAEALHEMKHPKPVAFVQQANIANGIQQVNNQGEFRDKHARTRTRAGEIKKTPNELLEHTHAERLDTCTTGAAISADPQLEAVGAVDRAENNGR